MSSGWPMYQYNSRRTGYNDESNAPTEISDVRLDINIGFSDATAEVTSPLVDSVYGVLVGRDRGMMYQFDEKNGRLGFAVPAGSEARAIFDMESGSKHLFSSGYKYTGTVNMQGQIQWKTERSFSSVLVDSRGLGDVYADTLYLGTSSGVCSLDSETKNENWAFTTSESVNSPPAKNSDTLFVGCADNHLYALDIDSGTQKWAYETEGVVNTAPAVVEGTVYFGSWDEKIYAVDAETGETQWTFETGDSIRSSPAVANETVYCGSNDGNVYAIDANTGEKLWTMSTIHAVRSSPAIANDTVFIGNDGGNLFAINASTGHKRWEFETGGEIRSSPAVAEGTVYFGSNDGHLYAIE